MKTITFGRIMKSVNNKMKVNKPKGSITEDKARQISKKIAKRRKKNKK